VQAESESIASLLAAYVASVNGLLDAKETSPPTTAALAVLVESLCFADPQRCQRADDALQRLVAFVSPWAGAADCRADPLLATLASCRRPPLPAACRKTVK